MPNTNSNQPNNPPIVERFTHLVGMTVNDALEEINKSGAAFKVRVKSKGGVYTQDYRLDRLNLHAEHGVVNKISIG